jgi:hypothetical protein
MTRCGLLTTALLLSLLAPPAAPAAAGSDAREPYQIRIVLSLARNPLLTHNDVFRGQVARELSDGLQAALGDLARVKVLATHPKLADVQKRGLQRGLDGYTARSPDKTYFVAVSFTGGSYVIQTRQHDGLLGVVSPTIRRDRTPDRAFVARTAALLIERDLGLLGTVQSNPDASRTVRVELKAGRLGALGRWVKKDEVFALVRVPPGGAGRPQPWAFLQVEEPPADGVCACKLYSRYRLADVVGLRCVLLGTRKGTLRLRLVKDAPGGAGKRLDGSVQVQVRHHGFEGEDATLVKFDTNGARDVDTAARFPGRGVFNRLAFVSVLSPESGTLRARIPVPLTDDGVVVLPVPAGGEEGDLVAFRVRSLRRAVFDSLQVQADLFKEINELTAKPQQRAAALAKVRQTLERCKEDHERLTAERIEAAKELAKAPAAQKASLAGILTGVDARLRQIKGGEDDLAKHVALLETIEKEENDPKKKEWRVQVERAKLLVKEAEVGRAIAIYEKAPAGMMTAELQKHLAELKKLWAPRDEKHAEARRFIYEVWPGLDTAGMKENVKKAMEALEVCQKAKDPVGPKKLQLATEKHVQRIAREAAALRPDVNIDDEKPAALIRDLLDELRKLDAATLKK